MIAFVHLLFAAAAVAAPSEATRLTIENCEVGDIYAFNKGECNVTLRNDGEQPIRVFNAKAMAEDDSVEPKVLIVPPHAHGYLKIKIASANRLGYVRHVINFRTDELGHEDRSARATAFVMSALDEVRPLLDFGVVQAAAIPVRKSVALTGHDIPHLIITKIIDAPAWLDASIAADGRTLTAAVKPDAGWGIQTGFVKVSINAPQQSQAWIESKADVHGDVVPNVNPYDMGLIRIGSAHEFHIPLRSQSGHEIHVGKVELEGLQGTTRFDMCEKPGGNCRMLILNVADQQPGSINGHVWIELPDYHQRLNLAVWGLLVPADFKVKTLEADTIHQDSSNDPGQSQASKAIDLQQAVKEAVDSSNNELPPGKGPLLKWTVANGKVIHGFQIFRAGDEAGPFELLTNKVVPSTAETEDSITYQYRDNSAQSSETYWYYIGVVYNDGHRQQLSGPQKVVAK